ncbi:MAG: RNA methyltransferase [Bacteroidota bacterium]
MYQQELIDYLLQYLNENRRQLLFRDLDLRSNHLTLILEDFYHAHNISATMRTADCFGLKELHIVENKIRYEYNPKINKGADKWIHLNRYCEQEFNTPTCLNRLKAEGYRIVATSPHQGSYTIRELDLTRKTAIVMGSEGDGISEYVKEHADAFLKIDMPGFTESLNVSVAAGIILETLTHRMRSEGHPWQLDEEERHKLLIGNLAKMVPDCNLLEKRFMEDRGIHEYEPLFKESALRRSSEIH